MFQPRVLTVAVVAATLTMAGCNSNDDDGRQSSSSSTPATSTKITVTPSLGKILNARVVLRNAKTGVDLAPAKTLTPSDNGTATFTVPIAKLAEPVIAAVLPTLAGVVDYADEAIPSQVSTITVPTADISKPILRVATTLKPNDNIGVTALTEAAVKQAEKAVGGLIAQNINTANAAVKNQLKLNFEITQAPIVIGLNEFDKLINQALDLQRRTYAAYLATLAKEAKRLNGTATTPAYDIAKAFAADFSDGTFDAKQGDAIINGYNSTFINAWLNWVQTFYSAFIKFRNADMLGTWLDNFNAVTPAATPLRVVDGIAEYSCDDATKLRSGSGGQLNIDFVNQRSDSLNIDWINFNGGLTRYRSDLQTGQTYTIIPTSVSHPWKVSTTQGQCIGVYTATTASNKTITFKSNEVLLSGIPVNTGGNPDSCASLGLPSTTMASLTNFIGNYNVTLGNQSAGVFTIEATGKVILNGQAANFKEVCGPNVQNNGTNFVLLNEKSNVTLFKDNAGVVTAEGADFTTTDNDVFFGTKVQASSTFCSSQGSDNKLGFANAPTDFCSFSYAYGASIAISSPDIYTFKDVNDPLANAKVTVLNGSVQTFQLENSKYAYACGVGSMPACVGITIQNDNNQGIEFAFNKAQLSVVNGATQGLIVDSGLLMHKKTIQNPTTLAASGTATGKITNVQFNKDGTTTGGKGELRANAYEFSGDLSTAYTLKINDTIQNLRYELANRNGQFTAVSLYSLANTASPLFVYLCDTTGDNSCLGKVSFTLGTTPTLVFTDMKLRGIFQPQFDVIINGQVKLNP